MVRRMSQPSSFTIGLVGIGVANTMGGLYVAPMAETQVALPPQSHQWAKVTELFRLTELQYAVGQIAAFYNVPLVGHSLANTKTIVFADVVFSAATKLAAPLPGLSQNPISVNPTGRYGALYAVIEETTHL